MAQTNDPKYSLLKQAIFALKRANTAAYTTGKGVVYKVNYSGLQAEKGKKLQKLQKVTKVTKVTFFTFLHFFHLG